MSLISKKEKKKSRRNGLELKCCFAPEETLCILFSGAFASLYLSAPRSPTQRTLSHSLPQIPASAPGCNTACTCSPPPPPNPEDSCHLIGRPTVASATWLLVILKSIWDFCDDSEQGFLNFGVGGRGFSGAAKNQTQLNSTF